MSRCEHGEMISIYCLNDTCTWREAGGCQNCFKRYHSHPSNVGTITQQKIQEYYRKMIIRPDPKVKSRILQEAVYNYFIIMKSHLTSSIDAVSRVITNRLNYPYLNQEGQLDIFNKIKLKQYKKIQKKQLKSFCEFATQNSKQDLQKKERQIYSQQVKNLQQHIKKINEAFIMYSDAIKKFDDTFKIQNTFVDKISQITSSISNLLKQGTPVQTDKSQTSSKCSQIPKIPMQRLKPPLPNSRDRDRKISFDLTSDLANFKNKFQTKYNENQLNQRKKRLLQMDKQPGKHDIQEIKVNLIQKDVPSKIDRIIEKSTEKSISRDFSSDNRFKISDNKRSASRENSDSQIDRYQILHTILPRQASKPKLYEHSKQVKQKKITVPVKISEEQGQCSSPILKKKKTMNQNNLSKGFGLFKVQSMYNQERQHQLQQKNQDKSSTTVTQQKSKQDQVSLVLKQRQTNSLALLVSSFACSAQQAIPKLQAALKYAYNNLSAAQYLSYLYLQIGKPKQCLTVCNQFLQQIEDSSQSVRLAEHLSNNKAAALNMLGRYSQSIYILQKCIQNSEKDIYYKNLGDAYFSIGIHEKAVINYQKAIKMNSSLDQALFNLAVCLYIQGHFVDAQLNVLKALKLNTTNQAYQQLHKELSNKLNV